MLLVVWVSFCLAASNKNIADHNTKSKSDFSTSSIKNGPNSHSVGIGLGQTFLLGNFDDNGRDSISLDLYYDYSASHIFDLSINTHYSKHRYRKNWMKISGMAIGIKGKIFQRDSFSPFIVAGLGLYLPKAKYILNDTQIESDSKLTLGTHIGIGGELRLNKKCKVGILGHLHNPFDVKQEMGHEIEGYYFKLLLTTYYTF